MIFLSQSCTKFQCISMMLPSHKNDNHKLPVAFSGGGGGGGGGQSLLNFRQNFQISDIPPICKKTVFSPLRSKFPKIFF